MLIDPVLGRNVQGDKDVIIGLGFYNQLTLQHPKLDAGRDAIDTKRHANVNPAGNCSLVFTETLDDDHRLLTDNIEGAGNDDDSNDDEQEWKNIKQHSQSPFLIKSLNQHLIERIVLM